jgi:pimeloyl-ACP methyl ester carboxylesterase
MSTEELLQAGIKAAEAGQFAEASKLLIRVVKTDPHSEQGWLWLGFCRTAPEQREQCFRRVLAINRQNAEARRQLEILRELPVQPQAVSHLSPSSDSMVRATPPSIEPADDTPPESSKTPVFEPAARAARPHPRKKKDNLLIWAGAGLALIACIAVAGILAMGFILKSANVPSNPVIPIPTFVPTLPPVNYKPVFETAVCDLPKPDEARVDCGFVVVPEDRSKDPTDTIRLAVAIYRSASSTPRSDPIIYLSGGPGGEAIGWSTSVYDSVIAPLTSERDFIVLDPRGVGRSQPVLNCDEFSKTYLQDVQGHIPSAERAAYYEGALLGCKNNLVGMGANPAAYTSADMAADVRDVVIALGYQQANLYGISYGTRVAQFVMRHHPEVVRSAILDSVVPVEVQLFNDESTQRGDVLQVLFEDCKTDPLCSVAYPDLQAAYEQSFNQLNAQPIHVTVPVDEDRELEQTIDGNTFHNVLLWVLRSPYTIPLAPQLIYRVRDGDYSILRLSLAIPIQAFDSISMGNYIAVTCHDQVFAMSFEVLDTTIHGLCQLWDVKPVAPGENDPVQSDIPTLIFAGRYDTTTPPAFAHLLAGHLTHPYVVEIPNQGHAPSATELSDCPTKLMAAFLQDPNLAPDQTCVGETGGIDFVVPFDGNTPVVFEDVTIEPYGVHTRIPTGWTDEEFGFYNRSGYWGDITQIGIQRTAISEEEWISWLSTNFQGTTGLDQPAVKTGERLVNGLKWSIYSTSAEGLLVDLAFAKSGGETLMVLMVSHKYEHDALFNHIFLHIVDSTKT